MEVMLLLVEPATRFATNAFDIDRASRHTTVDVSSWVLSRGQLREASTDAAIDEREWLRRSEQSQLVHLHGEEAPTRLLSKLRTPFLASWKKEEKKRWWSSPPEPLRSVDALALPEAVALDYFGVEHRESAKTRWSIGCYRGKRAVHRMLEQTAARLARFRDDVDWHMHDSPPSGAEIAAHDVWIDPAESPDDRDGLTAEALVTGTAVVATRTPANEKRLENGAAGFLVPVGDANEMTHSILTALFKPEIRQPRLERAKEIRQRFSPEVRAKAIEEFYRSIVQ